MESRDVLLVVSALSRARVRHWIAGGWGVDALLGRQTRAHRDLDLAIDADAETAVFGALQNLGYAVETDQRPARAELAAPGARWVDLHPVRFDKSGTGHQADLSGGSFVYPPTAFATGVLAGVPVSCLSAAQQLRFRAGYALRDVDRHDIALLKSLVTEYPEPL